MRNGQKRIKILIGGWGWGFGARCCRSLPPGPHSPVAPPLSQAVFGLLSMKIYLNHGYEVFIGKKREKTEAY